MLADIYYKPIGSFYSGREGGKALTRKLKYKNMQRADIVIESQEGVTIYGKVIDKNGRLGQFEVHSDRLGNNGSVYTVYKEAENRMKALIGIQNDKVEHGQPKNQQPRSQRKGKWA